LRRPEFIAQQSAHPRGYLGRVIARIMALETATPNRRVLELLDLNEKSRVLEVGFAHGHTLARAAELARQGFVAGIDISAAMVDMAQTFSRDSIAKGLIEVRQASSDQIPYPDQSFDRIFAVHTLYFWNDPLAHLREIRRVCRVGGRFVLAFGPREDARAVAAFPKAVYIFYSIDETQRLLAEAGFYSVTMSRERITAREIVFAVGYPRRNSRPLPSSRAMHEYVCPVAGS
jgi:ubiquinone/menaquinone biosynthesis C-methylase UbiE